MSFIAIDSFSGAGGLGLGLKRAGFRLEYSFDIDEHSVRTQNLNVKYFGHVAERLDIRDLDPEALMKTLKIESGELSLFAGGPPCQGFSVQRIGSDDDDRNNFVSVYMEKMAAFRPKFFLMENVPGINGARGKAILSNALQFAELQGYHIHKRILDAQDFGVPQRRRRMIIVGERIDGPSTKFSFPEAFSERITVRQVLEGLPEPPADGQDHLELVHHRRDRLSELNLRRIRHLKPGQGMEYLPEVLLADCHKAGPEKIGHRNVYGRMHWDDVAPTITARFDSFTRGLFGHPEQDRSISLREGAMLQTFPMDFIFSGSKIDIARQIGNAVPVNLAYAIGKQIISALR